MPSLWLLWSAASHIVRFSTVLQILVFLPLTLATLSTQAFLLLSFLLSVHSLIHGTLMLLWGSDVLYVLQLPMHPFLLLVSFNAFSSSAHPYLTNITGIWGAVLKLSSPIFIAVEGLSSLLVAQDIGRKGKGLITKEEAYQFPLLIGSAVAYVLAAWWIVLSYPAAAASPLSSTLLGAAITAFFFLTFIGFVSRRTNIIESAGLAILIAYNVWLCGFDQKSYMNPASSYMPLLPNILPHFRALFNFVIHTLPTPVLFALLYRLAILHLASRILPSIGADSWEHENGVHDSWEDRPTSSLIRILLTYRQFIFVALYSHLLLLDHSSQIWWRWMNIFLMLAIWSVELVVSPEEDIPTKGWKID